MTVQMLNLGCRDIVIRPGRCCSETRIGIQVVGPATRCKGVWPQRMTDNL
jgi:hypothetical protein